MNEKLEKKLKNLPEASGIYQMLDKRGNIIYIGKSKCLKKRVQSYFVPSPVWDKAKEMAYFIEDIEIIVTDTHLEAMLLECELIKKIKPHFNSMMKNDEKYIYLTLEENCRRNPLKITGIRENQSFGPFRSKGQLQELIDNLRNLYPITRKGSRYEFEYHVFPQEMEKEIFANNRKILKNLFSSQTAVNGFLRALEREMKRSVKEERFERAAQYRDLQTRFIWFQRYLARLEEWNKKDILYEVPLESGYKLFYISDGRIISCRKVAESSEEIRSDFREEAKNVKKELPQSRREKELLDYRDIVCAELAGASERVYAVE